MRAHRFPLFQADFSGFSLISSIAAISSFSVGILIIPTSVKEISIGTCFKPSSPFSLLWTSIRLIKVFTMVGINSFKSVHSRIASSKNLQINLFLFGFSDCLLVVFNCGEQLGIVGVIHFGIVPTAPSKAGISVPLEAVEEIEHCFFAFGVVFFFGGYLCRRRLHQPQ